MPLRTRIVSRSAACRLRRDLGSTTLCLLSSAVFVELSALRGSYVRLDHVIFYVRPLGIRVMDDVICAPTLYVVHD